jgi:hypothetical protein
VLPYPGILIFAGAICGSGPALRLHLIRDFQRMHISNIQPRGFTHTRYYAVHRLPPDSACAHRATAIFLRPSAMIFLSGFALVPVEFSEVTVAEPAQTARA